MKKYNKQKILNDICIGLKKQYDDVKIFNLEKDELTKFLDLVIVSDEFINIDNQDLQDKLLKDIKKILGNDFYKGIYCFQGMTSNDFIQFKNLNKGLICLKKKLENTME